MSNNSEHNSLWKLFPKVSDQTLIQFLLGYCPFNICFTCMLGHKYTFFSHDTYEVKVFCYSDNIYLLYIIYIFSLCHISMCMCVFVCLFLSMCMYTCDFQYLTLLWCCDGRIVCVLIKSNLSFSNFYDFFLSIFSDESLPGLWEPTTSVMAAIHVCFQGLIFKRCFLLIFS